MKCNYLCMGCGNLKSKFIATGLLAVFGTGAFSSYAGAAERMLENFVNDSSYEFSDNDVDVDFSSNIKYVVFINNNEFNNILLHNYDPEDEEDVALRRWINGHIGVLDIFPDVSEIVQKALNLSKEQFLSLEKKGCIPKKGDFVFNYLRNERFQGKSIKLGIGSEGYDFVKNSVENFDSFKENAKSVIENFFWDLNYEADLIKKREWISENEKIIAKAFPDMGVVVKEAFKLNESQLNCLKVNELIPERNDFVLNLMKYVSLEDIRGDGEKEIVNFFRNKIKMGDLREQSSYWIAITEVFNAADKGEDVSTKDKDWIKNLYALSGKVMDFERRSGGTDLEYWVGQNLVELYSMFPDMDEILKNALGLNEDKITELKEGNKFPSKVKFIVFYLKQIGLNVDSCDGVSGKKKLNYIRSSIKSSRSFRNTARAVLSQISCEGLRNRVVLSQIFPNLCGKLRNLVIVGIVVVALAILLLVFGALYMQKQPMSPNDQRKGQENSPTTIPSLDPEQGGNPEPEGNKFSVINEKILGLAGATIVSASAVGVGVNAAVNNNSVAVDVGKSEKVVSGNGENADKEEKVGLVYVH